MIRDTINRIFNDPPHSIKFSRDRIFKNNVRIGEYTYGVPKIHIWTGKYTLTIGKFCSISENVSIIVDGNHRSDWISTYPFSERIEGLAKNENHPIGKRDMVIGNDVWIGKNAMILPGVSIGNGAVIGAGSVVTKDVMDYEIVGGNPAKHIRYRFTADQIDRLLKIAWWDWPVDKVKENIGILESDNIEEFINKF